MGALTVEWLKWPSEPYRTTPMRRLGVDELGTWLFAPRGAAASYARTGPAPLPVHFLTLVPHGGTWWLATWMWGNPAVDIDVYVDVVHRSMPARADGWRRSQARTARPRAGLRIEAFKPTADL